MNEKVERLYYLDFLRVVATFFVILIHVSCQNWSNPLGSFSWQVANFYDGISRFSVPIFVMISGVLFLNTKKNLIKHYILRIF